MKALDLGAIENLIIWENLTINRFTVKNTSTHPIGETSSQIG